MADYKELYTVLFQGTTKAILILQEIQRKVEELYISSEESDTQIVIENETKSKSIKYSRRKIKQEPLEFD